jgi:hypothetical protein
MKPAAFCPYLAAGLDCLQQYHIPCLLKIREVLILAKKEELLVRGIFMEKIMDK